MNIKLSYFYRDAANYKNFGEVVFANAADLPLAQIEQLIRSKLIEATWFVADKWTLPDLHFKEFNWDSELDHEWHEYEMLEETTDDVIDNRDISEFIDSI
jgi:hypothetical protein